MFSVCSFPDSGAPVLIATFTKFAISLEMLCTSGGRVPFGKDVYILYVVKNLQDSMFLLVDF